MTLFASLALVFWIGCSPARAAESLKDTIPEAWKEFVRLDQDHNIEGREPMKPDDKLVRRVHVFQVPLSKLWVNQSEISPARRDAFIRGRGKDSTVKFFVLDTDPELQSFIREYGKPTGELYATKLQSWSTYFIWDPKHREVLPFSCKFTDFGKNSVEMNDYVSLLAREGSGDLRVLPEWLSLHTAPLSKKDPQSGRFEIIRDLTPVTRKGAEQGRLLPLHGLLGSDTLKKLAQAAGMTPQDWLMKEYLPKFAASQARLHFHYGLHFQAHTQNTLLEVDEKTGKIVDFVYRDVRDVTINPYVLRISDPMLFEKAQISPGLRKIYIQQSKEVSAEYRNLRIPGVSFGHYAFQSAVGFEKEELWPQYGNAFIKSYIQEAERITGKPIALSPKSKNWMDLLGSGASEERLREMIVKNGNPGTQGAMMEITQNIYDESMKAIQPRIDDWMTGYDQNLLRTFFQQLEKSGKVSRAFPKKMFDSGGQRYAFDGKGIFLLSRENQALAYAHPLTQNQVFAVLGTSSGNPANASRRCGGGVLKFLQDRLLKSF